MLKSNQGKEGRRGFPVRTYEWSIGLRTYHAADITEMGSWRERAHVGTNDITEGEGIHRLAPHRPVRHSH